MLDYCLPIIVLEFFEALIYIWHLDLAQHLYKVNSFIVLAALDFPKIIGKSNNITGDTEERIAAKANF